MSSNKTEHLMLHAWDPEDMFTREEFNENFAAIDGAAGALRAAVAAAQAAADAAQAAADAAQGAADRAQGTADGAQRTADGRLRIQIGCYDGDGTVATSSKKKSLTFDFRPQLVFLSRGKDTDANYMEQADLADKSYPPVFFVLTRNMKDIETAIYGSWYRIALTWGENTLSWYPHSRTTSSSYTPTASESLNSGSYRYHWIAIG